MLRRATIFAVLLPFGLPLVACADECQQLADRICECGQNRFERQSCEAEVESQQRNQTPPTEAEREACLAALETCTCEALADERTDLCGFTRDEGVTGEASE